MKRRNSRLFAGLISLHSADIFVWQKCWGEGFDDEKVIKQRHFPSFCRTPSVFCFAKNTAFASQKLIRGASTSALENPA